ncbi:MAG: ferrous iron transport protein B [Acidobacteriota bacterium]
MLLSEMNIGDKGEIYSIKAKGEIRRRILDMGLVKGVRFKVVRVAPLGDPIEIKLKGFLLSLRKEEARQILVNLKGYVGDNKPMREYGPLISPLPIEKNNKNNNKKEIVVALVGNPNSGKTSTFNRLVGSNQKVGNFPGVTVEKHEGEIKYKGYKLHIIDLPGTYSLTAYSPEEVITRNYLIEEKHDVVVDIIDSTNIDRNLYLTTQLMELESDMLVALNMIDEVEKDNIQIDFKQLQKLLGSHVIPTSAVKDIGINSLLDHIIRVYEGKISIAKNKLTFSTKMEEDILEMENILRNDEDLTSRYHPRWLAIKLFENDQIIYKMVKERAIWIRVSKKLQEVIKEFEQIFNSDPELVLTEDRHSFIRGAIKETVNVPKIEKKSLTDKIDSILINRILGLPIFLGIMWLIFQFTFTLGEPFMNFIESIFSIFGNTVRGVVPAGLLRSLLIDGIISGVGGVLVFIPNIILLFLSIALLEGTGYMSRAAFVIDKIMHKVGLHGKSFIPMITGFGCSVPAIMATRTLKNRSDRIVTMLIIPFMSCGAKLPVYILLIGAFFPPAMAGNILFSIYIFGVFIAIISAKLLKTTFFKGESEPFVMELPPYRMPTLRSLFHQTNFKAKMYIKKAGTIILFASIIIWGASNFPKNNYVEEQFQKDIVKIESSPGLTDSEITAKIKLLEIKTRSEQLEYSFAGRMGKFIEPVIKPIGFDWRIGVAIVAGFAAKEIVVSTLGTIFSLGEIDEKSKDLAKKLKSDDKFNKSVALALMIFVLLYVPCIAATTVFLKESGSWKWTRFYIFYTITVAWIMAFAVYRLSLLIFK